MIIMWLFIFILFLLCWLFVFIKPTIVKVEHLPLSEHFKAITIGPFVFTKLPLSLREKAHEFRHIKQQRWLSPWLFYFLYVLIFLYYRFVGESFFHAYWKIPFEKDARRYETIYTQEDYYFKYL